MIHLIRNENMKIYKRTRTWILIGVVMLFVVIQIINLKSSGSAIVEEDWRSQLEQEIAFLKLDASEPDALPIEIKQAEKRILLNQYHLDTNSPPSTNTWSFAVDQAGNLIVAISFIAVIIAGEIVSAEFIGGTIKLLLTRSASRTKIYISKYIASILFGLALLLIGAIISVIFGGVVLGFQGLGSSYFFVQNGTVEQTTIILALFQSYLLHIPFLLLTVTLAFMISAAFKSSTFSIVISLLVTVAGFVIATAMNGWGWTKYFVFSHTNLSQYVLGDPSVPGITFGFSVVFILLHLIVMHLISYPAFVKRDVV
ncbi:ABC-2 type transport system permease protein [Fontibacillus phaseoli]|uniref:ABC-2 type transport system permease protein n=1 Tax=Fontibacillus phaseoli TaxID=1416533 RepID=A0A369BKD8_9BACL|nr:ABC transporter permease subunit [Fontibacillus phaseoli]RCX21585.1 ABC-2 type transport system permease protein [Fontibacillus phaseoli]